MFRETIKHNGRWIIDEVIAPTKKGVCIRQTQK